MCLYKHTIVEWTRSSTFQLTPNNRIVFISYRFSASQPERMVAEAELANNKILLHVTICSAPMVYRTSKKIVNSEKSKLRTENLILTVTSMKTITTSRILPWNVSESVQMQNISVQLLVVAPSSIREF